MTEREQNWPNALTKQITSAMLIDNRELVKQAERK